LFIGTSSPDSLLFNIIKEFGIAFCHAKTQYPQNATILYDEKVASGTLVTLKDLLGSLDAVTQYRQIIRCNKPILGS
jgi:capsular polysaccharide biosynthesis protein